MKEKLKQKAIQSVSWVKENTMINGKLSMRKIIWFAGSVYGLLGFLKYVVTRVLKLSIVTLNKVHDILPTIIHFLEVLVSTLSYSIKKEFFYGFFEK